MFFYELNIFCKKFGFIVLNWLKEIKLGCFNIEKVAIHYYGRLAAKQGWRFDSTYDHKDETGEAIPFEFILGAGKVSP